MRNLMSRYTMLMSIVSAKISGIMNYQGSLSRPIVTGAVLAPSFLYSRNDYSHPLPRQLRRNMRNIQNSCITTPTRRFGVLSDTTQERNSKPRLKMGDVKIAIIGGGICGVTAAHAIQTRLQTISSDRNVEIVIYEADSNSFHEGTESRQASFKSELQPEWKAATCRNANSLVPGASMHITSRRSTLSKIALDSMRETYLSFKSGNADARDFSSVPPYFGFSLTGCIGWKASWDERLCFMTFLFHFLKTTLLTGENKAQERGKIMVQLARANRVALEKYITTSNNDLNEGLGLQKGFISVYRTKEKAVQALKEVHIFGEEAELLSRNEAIDLEPKLADLPLKESYYVHRKDDQAADCAELIRSMIHSFRDDKMISYVNDNGLVQDIRMTRAEDPYSHHRFQVALSDGAIHEFDHVILTAGIFSPIWAKKISWRAGQSCPIFPLRGYSLTLFTKSKENTPFLKKGMSFDSIYCTSVAPNMVRLTGFGEIAGFPDGGIDICRKVGPMVLEKYAKYIFGKDAVSDIDSATLPCFRPMSPDDVPLVGSIRAVPGLFIHSGHGTLGWTLSLATAHCLAQDVCNEIMGFEERDSYILPDSTCIHKSHISPDRFRIIPFL